MVLKPEYNEEMYAMKKIHVKSHQAITQYQVLSSSCNCALLECKTETGKLSFFFLNQLESNLLNSTYLQF